MSLISSQQQCWPKLKNWFIVLFAIGCQQRSVPVQKIVVANLTERNNYQKIDR